MALKFYHTQWADTLALQTQSCHFSKQKFKTSVMRFHYSLKDRATQKSKKLCSEYGNISTVFIAVFAQSIHTSIFFNSHMTAAVSWIKLNESAKRKAFCIGFCFLITINIVKQLLFLWPLERIGTKTMELIHNWNENVAIFLFVFLFCLFFLFPWKSCQFCVPDLNYLLEQSHVTVNCNNKLDINKRFTESLERGNLLELTKGKLISSSGRRRRRYRDAKLQLQSNLISKEDLTFCRIWADFGASELKYLLPREKNKSPEELQPQRHSEVNWVKKGAEHLLLYVTKTVNTLYRLNLRALGGKIRTRVCRNEQLGSVNGNVRQV